MSDYLNKKYRLELEVLSPLHIGAGQEKDWMKGADYVIDDGKLYKLNHKKLMQKISAQDLSNILLTKNENALKIKISGDIAKVADEVFDTPVHSQNDIKSFIKNGLNNKPIVPGSSLKGAIRSIILNYLLNDYKPNRLNEKEVFGDSNKGDEFMRFIKVSDAQFEETELVNTKIFNLFGNAPNLNGGWKHSGGKYGKTNDKFESTGFNTIYEIIQKDETGELTIALSDKALSNLITKSNFNISDKKKDIVNKNINDKLFAIINIHTKEYINKQIVFFEKYSNNETGKIIESLNNLLRQIPDDNSSCVLQMSAGSGFHSITGDWQFDDFSISHINTRERGPSRGQLNGKDSAKSRKIATNGNKFEMMGFVKLTVLTDEIIAKREVERKAKIEAERKTEEEKIRKRKEEQERVEAERQAKIEAERIVKEERIAKEKQEQQVKEALIKKNAEEKKQRQEANKAKREKEHIEILSKGLSEIKDLSDFNKGKRIIETYFKSLGSELIADPEQIDLLKRFVDRCIAKRNKRWKKAGKQDWVLIKKWVGTDTAQKWFESRKD